MPYWCSLAYLCNNIMNILNIMKEFKFTFVCKALAIAGYILASATSIAPLHAEPLVTLKQMVEKTISSNPEIQAKYHAYVGAGYEQELVKGGFLPKVDVQSTYRNQENINGVGSSGGTEIPTWNNELILRQMIFDGFATSSEVNSAHV